MQILCLNCPLYRGSDLVCEDKTEKIIADLVRAKIAANRRPVYIASPRHYLTRFAAAFPNIRLVTVVDLESWISKFAVPSSRQCWQNRISTLFSFAFKRGYIVSNPCLRLESITVDRKIPATLSVEHAASLLKSCPIKIVPYLTLALFAGVRPDEVFRMTWDDVNLETKTVRVDGKTRRRRIVPLEPIAVRLLQAHKSKTGKIAPSHSTVRRWRRDVRKTIGGKWTADILRHTAASMLLAKYQDAGKVATMLGNSPQILLTHYNNPVTAQEAEKFWNLTF